MYLFLVKQNKIFNYFVFANKILKINYLKAFYFNAQLLFDLLILSLIFS